VTRALVVLAILLSAACAHDTADVSGSLREVGGPAGAADTPIPGHVSFTAHGRTTVATAHADGSFSVSLAPGTYDVIGTSPRWGDGKGRCFADGPVTVPRSGREGLVVACSRR
jgi:hypothetical protein